jgi:DNA polymerase-3 subunit gamma/tau
VSELLGLVRAEVLAEVAQALLARDAGKALQMVNELARHGYDLRQFALELSSHLRDLAILKVCAEPGTLLDGARVDQAVSLRQAEQATLVELEAMIRGLQQAEGEMRRATQPRLVLEMALLRLTEIRRLPGVQGILDQLAALEGRLSGGQPAPSREAALPLFDRPSAAPPRPTANAPAIQPAQGLGRMAKPEPGRSPAEGLDAPVGTPPAPADLAGRWGNVVAQLKGRKRLASVLAEVRPAGREADRLLLEVPNGNAFVRETLEDPETRKLLGETASATFGSRLRVEYRFVAPDPTLLSIPDTATAARPQDDPLVREALSLFGGTIVREMAN